MRWLPVVEKTLVLGTGPLVADLLAEIDRRPRCGLQVIGIVTEAPREETELHAYPVLGSLKDASEVILEQRPGLIVVALPLDTSDICDHQLLETGLRRNVRIEPAAAVYERLTGKLPIENYAPEDVVFSHTFRPGRLSLLSARVLSLAVVLIGIPVFAPLMLLIAGALKLDSAGPVLFTQQRLGFGNRPFKLLKFRTMVPSEQHVSEWEAENSHRITRVGRWLRRFRLDELPQFFNILRGDMNLVGPRPHPVSNVGLFELVARNLSDSGIQIPFYALRSSVRPGMTGWAQVRYRYANNLQEELEKLRFDLYYLKHYSLWLDLRILLETARIVFAGHVVSETPRPDEATPVSADGQSSNYAKS